MIHILTATKEEYELAKKHLTNYSVFKTGVGASNVIKTLSAMTQLYSKEHSFINVGFCGSNRLPIGTVTKVSKSYRLVDNTVEFDDYRNGYEFGLDGHPCYTNNSFVTESTSDSPVIYDMELNYMVAFPIDLIGSVKIVSDNLDVTEYETTIDTTSAELWAEVRKNIEEIARIRSQR